MALTQRGINIPVTGQFQDGDDIVDALIAQGMSVDAAIGSAIGAAVGEANNYTDEQVAGIGESLVEFTSSGLLVGSGVYVTAPDASALRLTSPADFQARINPAEWAAGREQVIVSKWGSSGSFAYEFLISATGNLALRYSRDGDTFATVPSTVAVTGSSARWVRAVRDGAAGTLTFYTGPGDTADPGSWTQLGDVVSINQFPPGMHPGTADVAVGGRTGNSDPAIQLAGAVYRVILSNGTSTVADLDFTDGTWTSSDLSNSDAYGNTWTIQGAQEGPDADLTLAGYPIALASTVRDLAIQVAAGRLPSPSAAILALAARDGWQAVYDPTNPQTTVVTTGGKVSSISDGLGNLPPLTQGTDGSRPTYLPGEFGQLDGMGASGGPRFLRTAAFGPLAQPNTIVAVARNADTTDGATTILVDGASGARHLIERRGVAGFNPWGLFAGTEVSHYGTYSDTRPHIFAGTFDGSASTLTVDGRAVMVGDAGAQSLGGLSYGERFASTGNHWKGTYSVLLVYAGAIPAEVLHRMRTLLHTLTGIPEAPVLASATKAHSAAAGVMPAVDVNGDIVQNIASMTKVMTMYVAQQHIESLTDTVTLEAVDLIPLDPIDFQVGDVLTYHDLFRAMILPSSNTAAYAVARAVGTLLGGSGGTASVTRFLQEMEAVGQALPLAWQGHSFTTPSGGGNISARNMAQLLLNLNAEAVAVLGQSAATLNVTGPNARTINVSHSINPASITPPAVPLPGYVGGKTGTGGNRFHLGVLWDDANGKRWASVVLGGDANHRYLDLRNVVLETKRRVNG